MTDERHLGPSDDSAWRAARKAVNERNDQARAAGKKQRDADDRKLLELKRAERKRGVVYR